MATTCFVELQKYCNGARKGFATCGGIVKVCSSDFIAVCESNADLCQYSSADSMWSKLQQSQRLQAVSSAVYDAVHNRIFIAFQRGDRLATTDLKTGEYMKYPRLKAHVDSMVLIGDEMHMFEIQKHYPDRIIQHHIFDTESKALVVSNAVTSLAVEFGIDVNQRDYCGWCPFHPQAVFCKSRRSILISCGVQKYEPRVCSRSFLMEYSLNTQQYRRLEWSVSNGTVGRGIVSTLNERYIVIFGGALLNGSDHISVYDLKGQKAAVIQNIECPHTTAYEAVVLGSKKQDELVVFGFVRDVFKSSDFKNVQEVPKYLIQLVSKWYNNEKVHLIDRDTGDHWKIDMDEIINSFHSL